LAVHTQINVQVIRVHLMTNNTSVQPRVAQLLFLFIAFMLATSAPARAGGPVVWQTDSREDLLKGEAHGVSVTDTGALMLAPRFAQMFDTEQAYVWSLAMLPDGALAVGTGDSGKLYRVREAGAKPETSLLIDINETHVISLAVDAKGNLIAGTDPSGLVLRVSPDGKAFALFDAPLREIHALAPAPDGSIYALALGDAATAVRPPTPTPNPTTPA